MKFFLSVYEDRRELIELARRVWSSFGKAHIHPRAERQPDLVGRTDLRVGDYAGVFATDRSLTLVLATELLENSSRHDQQLTLQRRHLAAVLYRPWFGERAKYYVRMRQDREADLAAPVSDVALRPYEAFYELLRIGLFATLVADVPELAAEHAELKRLEEVALARLRDRSSAEVCSSLLALKDRLLDMDASADRLATAAPAYQDLYRMIMATA